MNQMGDFQMETYFADSAGGGGLLCWDETMSAASDDVFTQMSQIHELSLTAIGGEYIPSKHEQDYNTYNRFVEESYPHDNKRPCAIRLARTAFFKVRDT